MLTLAARGKEVVPLLFSFLSGLRAALCDSTQTPSVPISVSISDHVVSKNISIPLNPEQMP